MARIRTIKPEFWDSPSTASVSFPARLLFIALWNWADDHGRGTANLKELEGFAFPNDDEFCSCGGNTAHRSGNTVNFRDLVAEVSEAFDVVFYKVNNRPYYEIPSWNEHQRNERRAKSSKYPGPEEADDLDQSENPGNTRENEPVAETPHVVAEIPCNVSETPRTSGPGTWNRRNMEQKEQNINPQRADAVEEEPDTTAPTTADTTAPRKQKPTPTRFKEFWEHYPRKVGKRAAETAYRNATKRTDESTILDGVKRYATDPNLPDPKFIPHPATWLNRDGWLDEPEPAAATGTDAHRFMTATERKLHTTLQAGLAWAAEEPPSLDDTTPLQLTYEDNQQ